MKDLQQEVMVKNRSWHQCLVAFSVITLTLFAPFTNATTQVIGKVVYIDGEVGAQETLNISGSSVFGGYKRLKLGDEIFTQDMLRTLEGSVLKISFVDGAEITLRPDTKIFIEKYSQKEAEIEIIKGGIRVVTGEIVKQNPDLYKVTTPDGAVTARTKGSDFLVRICGKDCDQENKKMAGPKMKTDLPVIAKVVAIKGEVIAGNKYKRQLELGYPVYGAEHIVSSENSYAQLQFVDGSSVTVQAESKFNITNYKYNEAGKENISVFELLQGGLRFVSGSLGKNDQDAFSLHTPVATVGINGTDFTVNCVGNCSHRGIVSHVIDGSINQRNESGSYALEAGSYSAIRNQQSSPIVTTMAPVAFNYNIAPPPSQARVNTKSLFAASAEIVESGTYVNVKEGQVTVAGSAGEPVAVGENLSVAVGTSGSVSSPASASGFQMLDSTYTVPSTTAKFMVAGPSVNTIVIGGPGGIGINTATGSSAATTIVIQEQTIASPYIFR